MRGWMALVMVLPALAGCLADDGATSDDAVLAPPLDAAPVASYLHDVSEPIPGLSIDTAIIEQFQVPVLEDLLIDTWIARPDVDEPVPLVLEVTPYYGGGNPRDGAIGGFGRVADVLVERGYAVGIMSVRGTGNSEGCFTQGGVTEAQDTARVLEFLADQEWSNGNIGIMGVSYPGTTPQDVWVEAPTALKTIVPISGISDLYKYNFVNGVPINIQGFGFNTYYWAMVGLGPAGLAGGAQPTDPTSVPGAVAGEACEDQVEVQEGGVSSTLDGDKDAYWQERDFLAELRADQEDHPTRARASVFYIHGLQDWNVKPHMMEDWLPAIQETGVPFKAWLGQWGHAWPEGSSCEAPEGDDVRACRDDWWTETMVAWFDRFLLERETGVLDAPAVQVQDDDGVWRHEPSWPPADVDVLRFHPDEDGMLAVAPGSGVASYHDRMGGIDRLGSTATAPVALAFDGPAAAVFTSEPVTEDLHVSGLPVFHGTVTAEGERASLMLTLQEEFPSGERRSINYAALSLNHAAGLEDGADDISGQPQQIDVRFFPQDDVIHAGSKIVLVASGNLVGPGPGPSLQPISDGGMIHLDLDGAWFDLPVDRSIVAEAPQPYA